jgi:hypothetical protein
MKKILWFALALAMTFAFAGCEDEGPSMNEDYAGVWYMSMGDSGTLKADMTDTTFVNSVKGTSETEYTYMMKGTAEKISDGVVSNMQTHSWDDTNNEWIEDADAAEEAAYSLSADGTELTVISPSNGIMILTSTEP